MSPPRSETIYGRNPVYEVLRAGRRPVHRLLLAEGLRLRGHIQTAMAEAASAGIPIETVPRSSLDRIASNHQGVAAEVAPYPYASVAEILDLAQEKAEPPFVLLLDSLQDPQNLGTLLRTAEAVGVHGVVVPGHHTAGITSAVVSSSSGACEHLLVALENLTQAIRLLKAAGVWVVGLEVTSEAEPIGQVDLNRPLALVVGSEGQGMRRLVREGCDLLVCLPMRGRVESLNAAVAGSLALYAAWAARGSPGGRPSPPAPTAAPAPIGPDRALD